MTQIFIIQRTNDSGEDVCPTAFSDKLMAVQHIIDLAEQEVEEINDTGPSRFYATYSLNLEKNTLVVKHVSHSDPSQFYTLCKYVIQGITLNTSKLN